MDMPPTISRGRQVTVQCRVLDHDTGTPLGEEAGLPGDASFTYLHGFEDGAIPGLSQALQGVAEGFSGEVTIPPALAFGAYRPELVFEAIRENLPADTPLTPGKPLYTCSDQGAFQLRVVRLTDRGAVLDGNHPLAGRTLRVKVEVLSVRPAAAEEIAAARSATGRT
jgi:FKBP-type peptidyl-prolyl cis-trans isomerase SlyD